MKIPYRLRRNPAGKKVLIHTSNQVLVIVTFAIGYWLQLDKAEKAEILTSLGLDPYHLALYTLIATVVGFAIAKNTSIQPVDTRAPEQLHEDPDHEDGQS